MWRRKSTRRSRCPRQQNSVSAQNFFCFQEQFQARTVQEFMRNTVLSLTGFSDAKNDTSFGAVAWPTDYEIVFHLCFRFVRNKFKLETVTNLLDGLPSVDPLSYEAHNRNSLREAAALTLQEMQILGEQSTNPSRSRCCHPHVKHSTGMIMRHRKYNYTCVVSGWDPECTAPKQWQTQMGVKNLERGSKQPFYHVLVDDGSNRYAAEDNLIFEPDPKVIDHPEVGKYFEEFCGTHYRINAEQMREYSDDFSNVIAYVQREYPSF